MLCGCGTAPEQSGIFVMDTYFSVTDYGGAGSEASAKAFELMRELEKKLSVTDPESEISQVNGADGAETQVSGETAELISLTLELCRRTDGALDPTLYPVTAEWGFTTGNYAVPDEKRLAELLELTDYRRVSLNGDVVSVPKGIKLDFGATAKGFALKKAAEMLKSEGVSSAVLDLGGNIQTIGVKPDGTPWRAAIAAPENPSENLCVIEIGECSIATSGNYERFFIGEDGERYCHIIDPKSGRPVSGGLASVSVIGNDAAVCDALSTALFVMGTERAEQFWRESGDFEMILVEENGSVLFTEGLEEVFRLSETYSGARTEVIRR